MTPDPQDPAAELEALLRVVQRDADRGDRFAQSDAEGIRRRIASDSNRNR